MKTQRIYSKNAIYQKFEVLRANRNKRHKYNEFIVEGVRNIKEAVKNQWEIISFLYSCECELSKWAADLLRDVETKINYELPKSFMCDLSGEENTSELMAIIKMRGKTEINKSLSINPKFPLFDRPSNKGNLGTLLRSCDAFGVERLIITGHAVDNHLM